MSQVLQSEPLLRERVHELMPRAHDDLAQLVSMRSVADERQFPRSECQQAARFVRDAFAAAGLAEVGLHRTADGSEAVVGHAPGPPGSPTVLLYSHYDVQPSLGDEHWATPVWKLAERDGRWYGRGAADCKGNIVAHLTALRAFADHGDGHLPVGVTVVVEGSEEQGTGGLEAFVPEHANLLRADAILVCDTGNVAPGIPTLTTTLRGMANVVVTVRALRSAVHSGMFGGAAPDPLAALVQMLATLRDEQGATTVRGLDGAQHWDGAPYPEDRFRADATVLDGVDLVPAASVADLVWARPALTVLGIDVTPVVGSAAAIQPEVRARLNLRVPPGMDAQRAQDALVAHLLDVAPWHVQVEVEREAVGQPFVATGSGTAHDALVGAMRDAFYREVTTAGQGGSIPLCNVLQETFPDAGVFLMGVLEPETLMHAPNESVDPAEIERTALATALFLNRFAAAR